MTFRSDDDALHAKNRALEEDLAEARRELEEARPRLERAEALERELSSARAELRALQRPAGRPEREPGASLLAASAGFLVALTLASGGVLFTMSSQQRRAEAELAAVAHRARLDRARAAAHRRAVEAHAAEVARRARPASRAPLAERTGRVTGVEGPAPAAEGGACSVTVEPAPGTRFDARLRVECDGRTVYGRDGFGYLSCTMRDGTPERCEDRGGTRRDGDPRVVLDLPTDTVVVSDGPELPWTVRLALDPADG
jgi:hypothetical protein